MKKIILVDENECGISGHNAVYRDTLNTIEGTEIFYNVSEFPSFIKHPFKGIYSRYKYMKQVPAGDIICLMHIDNLYAFPPVLKLLRKRSTSVVGILHWFPKDQKRQLLFKMAAKYLDVIVVHSEYIGYQLKKIGVRNVKVVDYPNFCQIDLNKLRMKKTEGKKVFTCLGGSRIDKGPDILAKSFQYIPDLLCSKIKIVIAGQEGDVPYSYIRDLAQKRKIEIEFCNKKMSDEEYWQYVLDTDVILLPYKKIFTGNSGPMTDGISANKYILGPDWGNLGFLIKKYNLGSTFEIENPQSLGEEIGRISQINTSCEHEYRKKLEVRDFVESYKKIFENL